MRMMRGVRSPENLKDELADTAIQITCYDRNSDIVKRVTSADAGTVEDPENDENSENTNDENGNGENTNPTNPTNGGDDNGGGDGCNDY